VNLARGLYDIWTLGMAHIIGLRRPARAVEYMRQRRALLSYAAASRKGANRNWRPANKTADEHIRRDWAWVTARARDLARNSAHVSGALEKICNNVIFTGIRPQAQLRTAQGRLDRARNTRAEDHFRRWAEHRRVDFYGKQELALRHCWVDGEALVHFYESARLLREGVVPLGLEILEADHLDASVHGELANGNRAVRGVEFDAEGAPVAYHLFSEHPGGLGPMGRSARASARVPAERVAHVFAPKRASQTRGMSWLAAVIMEMHDFDEYQDAERIAARLTAAFGFFVETPYPEAMDPAHFGGALPGGHEGGEVRLPDFVEPGRIQIMPAGTKINAAGFTRPGMTYEPFSKVQLRGASAGLGMSYEAYSNDYTDASYSSARSAALEERRGYQKQQIFLNRAFNRPVWDLWSRFLFLSGLEDLGPEIPVTWQTPGWPWVDPYKDASAAKLELALGSTSRRRIAASRGQDLDEIMDELAEEQTFFGGLQAKENGNAQAQEE